MTNYYHLLNTDQQKIIALGGVPGSGKSTIAKEFEKVGYKVFCPDTYRGIISKTKPNRENWTEAMHESDQAVSSEAWELAYKEANEALKSGFSIVFDAMLQTQKVRRALFAQFDKNKLPYYSIFSAVEVETAKARNKQRASAGGRFVPEFVIDEKWKTQVFPQISEGFTETIVVHNDLLLDRVLDSTTREELISSIIKNPRLAISTMRENDTLKDFFPSLNACWGLKQDNVHHNRTLEEHMIKAAELIEDRSAVAVISTLLHDVGKSRTKEFFVKVIAENEYGFKLGEKLVAVKDNGVAVTVKSRSYQKMSESVLLMSLDTIEKDMNAHYYDHDKVGAILARRDLISLGFDEKFADDVYAYIVYHMDLPYKPVSKSSMQRLVKKVTPERMPILFAIRKADKLSGNTDADFLEDHKKMIEQVEEIVNNPYSKTNKK
ncbi:Zeta toxin [compost metagenome]